MTSIENKTPNDINLYNFLNGARVNAYTVPEEKGFHTTGNIGSLLNSNPSKLANINEGILFNPTNYTDSSNTIVGRVHPMKKDWTILGKNVEQPPTPQLYCNEQPSSELLPHYPNGIHNKVLNPTCNMTIGNTASATLAGISTAFINNPDVLNNPYNDIGHELNPYGFANHNGMRVLGLGKVSCQKLEAGLNVPPLKVETNNNGAYIANPANSLPGQEDLQDLYQVGNWSDPNMFPHNFINAFNENVGEGCSVPVHPVRPIPSGPGGRRPNPRNNLIN